MGMCKLNHWSQSSLYNYTVGITLLWMKYIPFPLDFQFSQVTCFGRVMLAGTVQTETWNVLVQLGLLACTLAKTMRRACPGQHVVQEDEGHVEQTQNPPTAWTQAQPNQTCPSQPSANLNMHERKCCFKRLGWSGFYTALLEQKQTKGTVLTMETWEGIS